MTASIVRSMKSDALAYKCDCSNEDEVARLFQQISNEIGPIDILVNNAGILNGKNLLMLSSDEIRKTFEVNVFAHFWVSSIKNSALANVHYTLVFLVGQKNEDNWNETYITDPC